MDKALHIYRPIQFQWFLFRVRVNQPSGCSAMISARFQEHFLHPWSWLSGPDGQMTMWHCTSTGQDSSNELDLKWICPALDDFQCLWFSRSPYYGHGHVHMGLMSKLSWCCISSFQDSFNELDLEWICQVVAEFWHSTRFKEHLLHPWEHPCGPQWAKNYDVADQDSSNELDLEWIGAVVAELWHSQSRWMQEQMDK